MLHFSDDSVNLEDDRRGLIAGGTARNGGGKPGNTERTPSSSAAAADFDLDLEEQVDNQDLFAHARGLLECVLPPVGRRSQRVFDVVMPAGPNVCLFARPPRNVYSQTSAQWSLFYFIELLLTIAFPRSVLVVRAAAVGSVH